MDLECRRAYGRGYNRGLSAGRRNAWPDHCPPRPPDELVAELMRTAKRLRDEVDKQCAMFSEDDEFAVALGPKIDELDQAMIAITRWVKSGGVSA